MRKLDRDRLDGRAAGKGRWRRTVRRTAACGLVLLPIACGGDREQEPPSAAAFAPIPRDQPLDSTLALLERELAVALSGQGGDDAVNRSLMRAEALSDRLLESRRPFDWLTGSGYSVEARLRQIQSLADRVAAQLRVRSPRDRMLADASDLRRQVAELRTAIAQGGGPAPTPLENLLDRRDTVGRAPATDRQDQSTQRRDTTRAAGGGGG